MYQSKVNMIVNWKITKYVIEYAIMNYKTEWQCKTGKSQLFLKQ